MGQLSIGCFINRNIHSLCVQTVYNGEMFTTFKSNAVVQKKKYTLDTAVGYLVFQYLQFLPVSCLDLNLNSFEPQEFHNLNSYCVIPKTQGNFRFLLVDFHKTARSSF